MTIKNGDIIKLSFTGKLEDGTIFETTSEEVAKENDMYEEGRGYGPLTIVVGSKVLIQGLEEELIGKKAGHADTVKVSAEKAFGLRRPDLIETIPSKKFSGEIEPGQHVEVDGRLGVIANIAGGRVKVDFNDPLAGKDIIYEYKIEDIIKDTNAKVYAIVKDYVGPEATFSLDDGTVTVHVPQAVALNEGWISGKIVIARFLISFGDIKKVIFQESFSGEDFTQE